MKTRKRDVRVAAPAAAAALWNRRWRHPLAFLALIAVSLTAYWDSFTDGFALDSVPLMQDLRIQQVSAQSLRQIIWHTYWWPTGEAGLYRPLTTLSWLFNYAVLGSGANPAGYHWVNWLLHTGNVMLVFALALRLGCRFRTSFFVAAMWALHPVLTESVTNISGRADLMAAMAVLGGFLLYLRSAETTGWRRTGWLMRLGVAAGAGACSKEGAVVLPAIIVLYEVVWWKAARFRALLYGCLATLLPIGAVLWQRSVVLAAALPAEFPYVDNPIAGTDFWTGRLTALEVLARYLWLVLWPLRLSPDYSYAEIPLARGGVLDWIAWATVAVAIGAAVLAFRRNRLIFFLACFAFLNLLPAANLLFPTGTIMAERLMYLPSVGLVAILVIVVERMASWLPRPSVATPTIFAAIGLCYGLRTGIRNLDWRDDLTIAEASVRTSPNSFKVHHLLAVSLFHSDPSHANIDRVIAEADKSLAILATVPDARNSASAGNIAATAHLVKGDINGGPRAEYERAAQIASRATEIEAMGRAAYNQRHGTQVQPDASSAESFLILATARLRLDEAGEALGAATEARAIDPSNPQAYVEIARADVAEKRAEDGAIALVEGMMITSDQVLRKDLLAVYQNGVDANGCAVVAAPRGPALNPACDIVRRDFCAAAARIGRQDVLKQFACGSLPK